MTFGLRNAGATYQKSMQKCLHDQIGKNVQVYVDGIVIKTKEKVMAVSWGTPRGRL